MSDVLSSVHSKQKVGQRWSIISCTYKKKLLVQLDIDMTGGQMYGPPLLYGSRQLANGWRGGGHQPTDLYVYIYLVQRIVFF